MMSAAFLILLLGIDPVLPLNKLADGGPNIPQVSLWCGPASDDAGIYLVELQNSAGQNFFRISGIEKGTGKATTILDSVIEAEGHSFTNADGVAVVAPASAGTLVTMNIKDGQISDAKFEFRDGSSVSQCLRVPNMTAGQKK